MPARHLALAGLEQEPSSSLGFVDPDFDQARGGDIAVFVADVVCLPQPSHQVLVVLAEFGPSHPDSSAVALPLLDPRFKTRFKGSQFAAFPRPS